MLLARFLSVWFLTATCLIAAERKPNLIFILADDLGYGDLGCYGQKLIQTPHLDRMAAEGMRFAQFYAGSTVCAPSRSVLMTGLHTGHTRVRGNAGTVNPLAQSLRPGDMTVARALKAAGYATAMFGKWHIGQQGPHAPGRRGFDEAIVSMGAHFDFATNPKTEYPKGQYLADFLTDRAVDFITRKKDGPFFLYLPHFGVHSPHQAKPELIAKFKGKPGVGGHNNPTYAAMIASVDESVGRVMAKLEELKLADNTVLIFASDNGGVGGYAREGLTKGGGGDVTDNAPLRNGKGSLYEGGTRVPFIVRWPGQVKAGTVCDVPAIHVDVYPTFVALAGGAMPAGQVFDGESLVPLLRASRATLQREAIYQHFPGYLGIGADQWRTTPVSLVQAGDWKLMEYLEDGRLELYNLREDLGEAKNLAATMPDKAKELQAKLVAWRAAVKAPMPAKNEVAAGGESTKKKGKGKKNAKEIE